MPQVILHRAHAPNPDPAVPPHLANAGFVLVPNTDRIRDFKAAGTALVRGEPKLVGRIPNLKEFGAGDDIYGGMYIIKSAKSDQCILPQRDKPFLATLQDMIDREYARGGAHDLVFAIRPSRHTAAAGEAHQRHIPGWHNHHSWGDHRIQSAADRMGTQFKLAGHEVAAPNGSVAEFDGSTMHRTPRAEVATRRTFLAFMALEPQKAYRNLQGGEFQNPADKLLGQQPYRSYDHEQLMERWRLRGGAVVALQQAKAGSGSNVPLQFISLG